MKIRNRTKKVNKYLFTEQIFSMIFGIKVSKSLSEFTAIMFSHFYTECTKKGLK